MSARPRRASAGAARSSSSSFVVNSSSEYEVVAPYIDEDYYPGFDFDSDYGPDPGFDLDSDCELDSDGDSDYSPDPDCDPDDDADSSFDPDDDEEYDCGFLPRHHATELRAQRMLAKRTGSSRTRGKNQLCMICRRPYANRSATRSDSSALVYSRWTQYGFSGSG